MTKANTGKFPECDSCVNREFDPFQCDSCDNGSNFEFEEDSDDFDDAADVSYLNSWFG